MSSVTHSGPQFEDEVRNIARNLFSHTDGQGSIIIDGRERDGVFFNGDVYTVIEATTLKTKAKAEQDGKKTHDLVTKLRKEGKMARGYLVTLHEPTADQKAIIQKKSYDRTTLIISFDELRSKLFDALTYINNRSKKRFGSVYDHVDNNYEVPLADFVEPTIINTESTEVLRFKEIADGVMRGDRFVLVAEYGVGKSMVLRHLFHELVKKFRSKKHFRTPISINLREHLGQSDPIELLERHARANATNPQSLVAAWNAGYVDLLIDGFDELSTRGWTGDIKRLKEYRRSSHSVVRKLIKETPNGCGIIIVGRDVYFDSEREMREALGTPHPLFSISQIHPFDSAQATQFLRKKNFINELPDWIPTRPLLLTYLVTKNLLQTVVETPSDGEFSKGSAWISLLEMVSERESDQSEGIDRESLLQFFGALGTQARHTQDCLSSFSPQKMETIFLNVNGNTIMEDERNILLRLPGLGAAQDSPLNRSFIDMDFMNACCAIPTLRFIESPYSDFSCVYSFESLQAPANEVGIEAISFLISRRKIQCGVLQNAIERALSEKKTQLAFDIYRASLNFCDQQAPVLFEGIEIEEIDLTSADYDDVTVEFFGCLINRVVLPSPDETNTQIKFKECLIGTLEGRVSQEDINDDQFFQTEIRELTDKFNVNNEVLGTSLPLGVRVLVVTLRKLFTQHGSSRLESALYRGLDQRSKLIVPNIIAQLLKHGFIIPTGRKGKITYSGTKAKRNEALRIIQAPNAIDSNLVKDCADLA